MEQFTDVLGLLNLMARPAFAVQKGIIVKVNADAAGYIIETGASVASLLETGAAEYQEFNGGCLYLTLSLSGKCFSFSVTRIGSLDIFSMEENADHAELQAMALASRELREPLSNVLITADRLFPMVSLDDDPHIREQVARINRGLFQMLRVISNMSDASQYCTEAPASMELRDVCAVTKEIFDKAAALVEHANIRLIYNGYPESIYSLIDSSKLERAIYNIVSNAVKFSPSGSTIHAQLSRRGNRLYLTVQDNGTGIDDHLQGTVFSRFSRQSSLEDSRFGIGLGMVLIRSIAALHGGTVLIDQPGDTGTRVTMTLEIRQTSAGRVRSPILMPDYGAERDHGLIEFSQFLPSSLYDPDHF